MRGREPSGDGFRAGGGFGHRNARHGWPQPTKRIKEDPALRQLPVILFSSLITDKLRHKGDAVGADDQISKPEITQLAKRAAALIQAQG